MKTFFCNNKIKEEVDKIHASFCTPTGAVDLIDFAIVTHKNQGGGLDASTRLSVRKEIMTTAPKFAQFGIYDMPACNYLEARGDLLRDFPNIVRKPLEKVTLENLERLSLHVTTPMQAYFIKHACIALGFDTIFMGIQPYTRPVDKITRILYGTQMTQYRHTLECIRIATECGTNPTYINTAFWILGERS